MQWRRVMSSKLGSTIWGSASGSVFRSVLYLLHGARGEPAASKLSKLSKRASELNKEEEEEKAGCRAISGPDGRGKRQNGEIEGEGGRACHGRGRHEYKTAGLGTGWVGGEEKGRGDGGRRLLRAAAAAAAAAKRYRVRSTMGGAAGADRHSAQPAER